VHVVHRSSKIGSRSDEWGGIAIVGFDEGIDMFLELLDRGEGRAVQGLSFQYREPDFHLVSQDAGRREVKMNMWMTLEPAVILGLVGVE
jgi:hypothetical protein